MNVTVGLTYACFIQELLIRKKDGPSQKFMGTERESRERAQDANVVGAGNLNVRNKLNKSLPMQHTVCPKVRYKSNHPLNF